MPSVVERGPISDRVLKELKDVGFPVGDNSSPDDPFGWSGEPNAENSTFTPWMMLAELSGQPQKPPGGLGDTGTEWILPYSVFYAGLSRRQTEALADRLRDALVNIERENVTGVNGSWRIQKISCTAIGSSNRIGSAYPDYFSQTDTFEVWTSKGR